MIPTIVVPLIHRIDPEVGHLDYSQSLAETVVSSDSAPPQLISVARAGLALLAVLRNEKAVAQKHYSFLITLRGTLLHTGVLATDRLLGLLCETVEDSQRAEGHFEDSLRSQKDVQFE